MLKKILLIALAMTLVFPLVLTACGSSVKPDGKETKDPPESGKETEPGETEPGGSETSPSGDDSAYVKLSETGESLYKATYDTMLNRTEEDGYAATSITGAYGGMFVRDSSIQVMSHIANGDLDYAASILRFIASYHIACGSEFACHVMSPVMPTGTPVDYRGSGIGSLTNKVGNLSTPTALYLIGMPEHKCAQEFKTLSFDTIRKIRVYLLIEATQGDVEISLGTEPDDASLGKWTYKITEKINTWVELELPTPVTVDPDELLVLTVGAAANCNGKVISSGLTEPLEQYHSYNYDTATFGGWHKENCAIGFEIVGPEPDSSGFASRDVAYFTDSAASQILPSPGNGKFIVTCSLALARLYEDRLDELGANISLYAGDRLVSTRRILLKDLSPEIPAYRDFKFDLPLFPLEAGTVWSVRFEPDEAGSCVWFGRDKDHLSYSVGSTRVQPASNRIQVDGNYMLVNAFAMFVAADTKQEYKDLIEAIYPTIEKFTDYFISDEQDYLSIDNLMRNPCYEHSRNGRYWDCYDLITNCFTSEALHKMSAVAAGLGKTDKSALYKRTADEIARGVHEGLVSEINGKKIYTELIALDENGKVYKGFSFVSLAPVACDWYAMDDEIMENTYNLYLGMGGTTYGGAMVLPVVVVLNDQDKVVTSGDHVIGKGLAWELLYLWKTGKTERLQKLINFVDKNSKTVYPEVWRMNGTLSDSANQEHANWLIYEIARISGKSRIPED